MIALDDSANPVQKPGCDVVMRYRESKYLLVWRSRRVGHVYTPAGWLSFKVAGNNFITTPASRNRPCVEIMETNLTVRELDLRKAKSYASARARDAFRCCVSKTVPRARGLISCWWWNPFLIPRKVLIEFPLGFHLPHTPQVTITGCRGFVSSSRDRSNGPAYIYPDLIICRSRLLRIGIIQRTISKRASCTDTTRIRFERMSFVTVT
jgi:hypothetical protein